MSIHESGEDYLETIYLLTQRSPFVRAVDIANELGYTKASVSRAMRILRPIHIGESAASQTCHDAIAANGGAGRQDAIVAG